MFIYKLFILFILLFVSLFLKAEEKQTVGITSDMLYVDIQHKGNKVRIKRIQNEQNKLTGSFSKTSRPCPPFCISPMEAAPNVKTVGELEVINFLKKGHSAQSGLLIDSRLAKFYEVETIPGAINIPFILFSEPTIQDVVPLLGVKKTGGQYDFSHAKSLYIFCNGPCCGQSLRAIKALIHFGYPRGKLYYYRGGMQLWKLFSLTTVLPTSNKIDKE